MNNYKIVCFRAKYDEFKKTSSSYICSLPAKKNDEFALLSATNTQGAIGFDTAPQGISTLKKIIESCYFFDMKNLIQPPKPCNIKYMPEFLFRDKNGAFQKLLDEHRKYEINLKRYEIISTYRKLDEPSPSVISEFLQATEYKISRNAFEQLNSSCHYIAIAKISGEYGFGAFDVFSKNLDFFFSELEAIIVEPKVLKIVENLTKICPH